MGLVYQKLEKTHVVAILYVYLAAHFTDAGAKDESFKGYIVYCPCMGRFGNQAEQLLGSLLFARTLNRTLVLPPFIHYEGTKPPELIPFEQVLDVNTIALYHDVITLDAFVNNLSDDVWPKRDRMIHCYGPRSSSIQKDHCDGLRGEPYTTFWKHLQVSDTKSGFYRPLRTLPEYANKWNTLYPIRNFTVLAFISAPSSFPTHKDSISIQKYVKFSKQVVDLALDFKSRHNIGNSTKYLSIHLRHGSDWKNACRHLLEENQLRQLFSSNQCTGYEQPQDFKLSYETCLPSRFHIVDRLKSILAKLRESSGQEIKTVHIATDKNDPSLWTLLSRKLPEVEFLLEPKKPGIHQALVDLYLMAHADGFIGNCISSFSAFAARIRTEQLGKSSSTFYFGQNFTSGLDETASNHEEL